jgi:2-polyprenyl-3-methyl-5-hydroxy-6-metoxy-1,4-benzoquinol methylase
MGNRHQVEELQIELRHTYPRIPNNPRHRKARKFLERWSGERLLDVGCGSGDFSAPLVSLGWRCHGIEIDQKAIEEAASRGIQVRRASLLDRFPYEDTFFDVVLAGEVIEHTIDDLAFLGECHRVLRPDGLLILTTPNLVSLGNRMLMLLGRMPRFAHHACHYRMYNARVLTEKMVRTGFKLTRLDSDYILVSTYFSKTIGRVGEWLPGVLPVTWGERLIAYATRQ